MMKELAGSGHPVSGPAESLTLTLHWISCHFPNFVAWTVDCPQRPGCEFSSSDLARHKSNNLLHLGMADFPWVKDWNSNYSIVDWMIPHFDWVAEPLAHSHENPSGTQVRHIYNNHAFLVAVDFLDLKVLNLKILEVVAVVHFCCPNFVAVVRPNFLSGQVANLIVCLGLSPKTRPCLASVVVVVSPSRISRAGRVCTLTSWVSVV